MHQIVSGTLDDSNFMGNYADSMFRMRYRVFHQRLKWEVQVRDGQEIDQFDDPYSLYLLATDDEDQTHGGWRLRPTTLPYLMADVSAFEPLLYGIKPPRSPKVWEISRFAVEVTDPRPGFGFNDIARSLLKPTLQLSDENGIEQYVMVISVAIERLLKNLGLVLHRFGPPMRIGKVLTVACLLNVDEHTRHIVLGTTPPQADEEIELKIAA